MKTTIYTKPFNRPDDLPTRVTESIRITEKEGKVTKIEKLNGSKFEEVETNGSSNYLPSGEIVQEFLPFTINDPEVGSTLTLTLAFCYKITDEEINNKIDPKLFLLNSQLKNTSDKLVDSFLIPEEEKKEFLKSCLIDCIIIPNVIELNSEVTNLIEQAESILEQYLDSAEFCTDMAMNVIDGKKITDVAKLLSGEEFEELASALLFLYRINMFIGKKDEEYYIIGGIFSD